MADTISRRRASLHQLASLFTVVQYHQNHHPKPKSGDGGALQWHASSGQPASRSRDRPIHDGDEAPKGLGRMTDETPKRPMGEIDERRTGRRRLHLFRR